MRQLLALQHHKHTGKLLHHQHTSYRALAVVFIVAGLFMVGLNAAGRAAADSFGVSAWVNIPVPSNPPTITSPSAGATVTDSSALIIGSCPLITPQVIVSISVDGNPSGTGACDSSNDFSVPVSISGGNHQVVATVLTVSGQKGQSSSPITITSLATDSTPSVDVSADQPFTYAASKDVTWTGSIGSNGQGTEYVHVDWGDNSQSDYAVQPGPQSFSHHYATLTSHNMLLAVTDTSGGATTEQFATAAFTTFDPNALAATTQTSWFGTSTVLGLYGLYLTALAVVGIVWLEAKHAAREHAFA